MQRRWSRVDADDLKVREFAVLLVAGCGIELLLLIAIWMPRVELPANARTTAEWVVRLRARSLSTRTGAVRDLSRAANMPILPCDVMVAKLTDVAAVRIQSVVLLTKVLSRGRCIPEVLDVLASSAPVRSRVAAAQVVGAALNYAKSSVVSRADRALAKMAGTRMLLDPDLQIREAAEQMLGRITGPPL